MSESSSASAADTGRIGAFSDGVFAIVITLLVLEVKVPAHVKGDAALWHAIVERLPAIGAWVVSFAFVLVFWVAHHALFSQLKNADRGLLWINGLFLLALSFTPFPTALAAEYPGAAPAAFMLSLAMFLTACAFSLLRWYAGHARALGDGAVSGGARRAAMRRSLLAPALYAAAIGLSLIWTPGALAIQILVPVIYFFPARPAAAGVGARP